MQAFAKVLVIVAALIALGLWLTIANKPAKQHVPTESTSNQISQEVWQGSLEVGAGMKLRLILKISRAADGTLSGTLDSLDQSAMNLPIDSITFQDKSLRFEMKNLVVGYEGALSEDGSEVTGQWNQGGQSLPLTFQRVEQGAVAPELKRPQEPKRPFPAVLLITGSGPEDRDETVFGHRPFLILADDLTRRGIAVVRLTQSRLACSATVREA